MDLFTFEVLLLVLGPALSLVGYYVGWRMRALKYRAELQVLSDDLDEARGRRQADGVEARRRIAHLKGLVIGLTTRVEQDASFAFDRINDNVQRLWRKYPGMPGKGETDDIILGVKALEALRHHNQSVKDGLAKRAEQEDSR